MAAEEPVRRNFPERIGRYQILERIGRGAMGIVYRARDEAMGREVALKVLTADLEDDPDIRTRFQREAEAAARLSHPNIITIVNVGDDGHRFFIVMELLKGMPLKDFLKTDASADIDRKVDLMTQLCAGLSAAHNAGIFHRDIKPGNVFVRSDGILKILDFGVARLSTSSMTASGFIVGTPDYMSPEQASGTDIDQRSDIFSLGGVIYYMLSGRKPFPATHLPTLFHQIQHQPPQPIQGDAPPALVAIAMKALAKAPEDRYQTCKEVIADLDAFRMAWVAERRLATARVAGLETTEPASRATVTEPGPADDAGRSDNNDSGDTVAIALPVEPASEDTVALPVRPPSWRATAARWLWSAMAALARLRGATIGDGPQTGMRKRSM